MFLNSAQKCAEHRRSKRDWEIRIAIDAIARSLKAKAPRVLEFGCGEGYQLDALKRLGAVTCIDLFENEDLRKRRDLRFERSGIDQTPFTDNEFDLIFSNHVIEHIQDLPKAFSEMKRIGKADCLFAFSVPTHLWLLLSVPGHYLNILDQVLLSRPRQKSKPMSSDHSEDIEAKLRAERGFLERNLFPVGHGIRVKFRDSYRFFRPANWRELFRESGFELIEEVPLLLYGPSEFPVLKTRKAQVVDRASSVLYLLRARYN